MNTIINTESFTTKMRITGKNSAVGNTKDVEIAAPLSNFLENY